MLHLKRRPILLIYCYVAQHLEALLRETSWQIVIIKEIESPKRRTTALETNITPISSHQQLFYKSDTSGFHCRSSRIRHVQTSEWLESWKSEVVSQVRQIQKEITLKICNVLTHFCIFNYVQTKVLAQRIPLTLRYSKREIISKIELWP